MSLTNIKSKSQAQRGFTIVELLIVVVVIAILAAITIVSYNGITNRANQSSAKSAAANVQKKAELYFSQNGAYPTVANLTGASANDPWATPASAFTTSAANPDADNGKTTVRYEPCGASAPYTGARIIYQSYGATDGGTAIPSNTVQRQIILGTGTCPTI